MRIDLGTWLVLPSSGRRTLARFAWLVAALLCSGCLGVGKEVDSLDPSQWESDEGVVVVRFLTARAEEDDLAQAEYDPDLSYSVVVGSSKSIMLNQFVLDQSVGIDAADGPALVVRKLAGGDYYFNKLRTSGKEAPMAIKFTVQPGRVTYIGDLNVLFIVGEGFLWQEELSCVFGVTTDLDAAMAGLRSMFPEVPAVDTIPMVVEKPGF